jgi:transposase
MAAYSQDLRDRVWRGLERGERPVDIARRLEVTRVWVYQVKARYEQEGERSSRRLGGYRRSRVADGELQIRAWIAAQPDLTLAEMCERLAGHGIAIKPPALWHQLNRWGLSLKKNPARQRARARRRPGGAARLEGKATRTRRRQAGVS